MKPVYLSLLLCLGCSSVQLAPTEMRRKEYAVANKNSKETNFDKMQLWASKVGGTMRLNDRKTGQVVVRANVPCTAVNIGNGYSKGQIVWFTLEMHAHDKKINTAFTNLEGQALSGGWDNGLRPSNQADVDKIVKECIDPIQTNLESAI